MYISELGIYVNRMSYKIRINPNTCYYKTVTQDSIDYDIYENNGKYYYQHDNDF